MIYIYGLIDPRTDEICYVGQSVNHKNRLKQHLIDKNDTSKTRWIAELQSINLAPNIVVLDKAQAKEEANYKENWWIVFARHKQWQTVNGTRPSDSRADFSQIFDAQLQEMYEQHQQARDELENARIALAVETERLKWANRRDLVIQIVVVVSILIGSSYFFACAWLGRTSLATLDSTSVWGHLMLGVFWLATIALVVEQRMIEKLDAERPILKNNFILRTSFGLVYAIDIYFAIVSIFEFGKLLG